MAVIPLHDLRLPEIRLPSNLRISGTVDATGHVIRAQINCGGCKGVIERKDFRCLRCEPLPAGQE